MIYCVEDDESIRDIEIYTLHSTGFEAQGFSCSEELFAALPATLPELILLDVMLPGMDGVEILKLLRESPATHDIPVIMATAKGAEYDKIKSLDLGADDYLVKPFGMMEMVSRVKAVLRRSRRSGGTHTLRAGALLLNLDEHTVSIDSERIDLTLKEYELLKLFLLHPGMVFTRDQILSDIWGLDYDGETRTVDVHIRTLRTKLKDCKDMIETVRGVGYRLEKMP